MCTSREDHQSMLHSSSSSLGVLACCASYSDALLVLPALCMQFMATVVQRGRHTRLTKAANTHPSWVGQKQVFRCHRSAHTTWPGYHTGTILPLCTVHQGSISPKLHNVRTLLLVAMTRAETGWLVLCFKASSLVSYSFSSFLYPSHSLNYNSLELYSYFQVHACCIIMLNNCKHYICTPARPCTTLKRTSVCPGFHSQEASPHDRCIRLLNNDGDLRM